MHIRTWQQAYAHALPAEYLAGLDLPARVARWQQTLTTGIGPQQTLVAGTDQVVGFVSVGPDRNDPTLGEVYAIYVDPDHWSTGVGKLLMDAAVDELRGAGFAIARLWVLVDNPRARRFYDRYGFAPDGAEKVDTIGAHTPHATDVAELRYALDIRPPG